MDGDSQEVTDKLYQTLPNSTKPYQNSTPRLPKH
jgi:hypothetical protein